MRISIIEATIYMAFMFSLPLILGWAINTQAERNHSNDAYEVME